MSDYDTRDAERCHTDSCDHVAILRDKNLRLRQVIAGAFQDLCQPTKHRPQDVAKRLDDALGPPPHALTNDCIGGGCEACETEDPTDPVEAFGFRARHDRFGS